MEKMDVSKACNSFYFVSIKRKNLDLMLECLGWYNLSMYKAPLEKLFFLKLLSTVHVSDYKWDLA